MESINPSQQPENPAPEKATSKKKPNDRFMKLDGRQRGREQDGELFSEVKFRAF